MSQAKCVDIHSKLAVLANTIKGLKNELDKERIERSKETSTLKGDITVLRNELGQLRSTLGGAGSANMPVAAHQVNILIPPKRNSGSVVAPNQPVGEQPAIKSTTPRRDQTAPTPVISTKQQVNEPPDRGSTNEDVDMAVKSPPKVNTNRHIETSVINQGATRSVENPAAAANNITVDSPTYSEVVQVPGDWNLTENKKQKRRDIRRQQKLRESQRSQPQHQQQRPQTGKRSGLRGCVLEKGVQLYLEHIQMCVGDTDDDLIHMAKEHGQANGIRVMNAYVIHNRVCTDMVGCKITVPESQVERAMLPDFWAKNITCRIWEQRRRQRTQERRVPDRDRHGDGRDGRYGGGGFNDYCPRRDDWDNHVPRRDRDYYHSRDPRSYNSNYDVPDSWDTRSEDMRHDDHDDWSNDRLFESERYENWHYGSDSDIRFGY